MPSFLIVYRRSEGRILRLRQFCNRRAAIRTRFEAERQCRSDEDVDVVVLHADSLETVKRTHSRYFGAQLLNW